LNGQQLRGTNKILISANADGGLLLSFFGHEQGHSIKENAPAMFDELMALTKKLYQTGNKDYDKELERLVKLGYTEADAQEEIVCNSLYKVYNKGFIQKLIEKFPQQANGLKKSIDSMLKMYDTAAKMLGRANMDILGQDNTRTVLAEIQATYEKAMDIVGEKNKARVLEESTSIENVKHSIKEIIDEDGNNLGTGVYLDGNVFDGLNEQERIIKFKELVKKLAGQKFKINKNGQLKTIEIAGFEKFVDKNGRTKRANHDLLTKNRKNIIKQEAIALIDEIMQTTRFKGKDSSTHSHGNLDVNGWEYYNVIVQEKNGFVYKITLNVANDLSGYDKLYDVTEFKKTSESHSSNRYAPAGSEGIPSTDNITENGVDVKPQNSILEKY
jgi:DNA-binding ferritin-like protein